MSKPPPVLSTTLRAYSFGHLLKTVEVVEAEIPFIIIIIIIIVHCSLGGDVDCRLTSG